VDSLGCIVTRFWARKPTKCGSFSGSGENLSLPQNNQTGQGDHPAANSVIAVGFPREKSGRRLKLTTLLHTVPRLEIREISHPIRHKPS